MSHGGILDSSWILAIFVGIVMQIERVFPPSKSEIEHISSLCLVGRYSPHVTALIPSPGTTRLDLSQCNSLFYFLVKLAMIMTLYVPTNYFSLYRIL